MNWLIGFIIAEFIGFIWIAWELYNAPEIPTEEDETAE